MELKRFDIKFFADDPTRVRFEDYTSVFTRWRDEDPEEWLDIADYVHIPSGPGMMLIGKDHHVSLDNRHGRPGLLYSVREPLSGSNAERIAEGLRRALGFAARIEAEESVSVRFDLDVFEFIVNDRVSFPNEEGTSNAVQEDLRSALGDVFGAGPFEIAWNDDPRERLTLTVTTKESRSAGELLRDATERI